MSSDLVLFVLYKLFVLSTAAFYTIRIWERKVCLYHSKSSNVVKYLNNIFNASNSNNNLLNTLNHYYFLYLFQVANSLPVSWYAAFPNLHLIALIYIYGVFMFVNI